MGYVSGLAKRGGDIVTALTVDGKVWRSADGDANDVITSVTSFADTTPTIVVEVDSPNILLPIEVAIGQAGTVGTSPITIICERDNIAKRSASGTLEAQYNCYDKFGTSGVNATSLARVYTGATGTAGYGVRMMGKQVGADIDTAEGVDTEYLWTPNGVELIGGGSTGGSWIVYVFSNGGTGATLYWQVKFAAFPNSDM